MAREYGFKKNINNMPSEREIQLAFALKWALNNLEDSFDLEEQAAKLRAEQLADEALIKFKRY